MFAEFIHGFRARRDSYLQATHKPVRMLAIDIIITKAEQAQIKKKQRNNKDKRKTNDVENNIY